MASAASMALLLFKYLFFAMLYEMKQMCVWAFSVVRFKHWDPAPVRM